MSLSFFGGTPATRTLVILNIAVFMVQCLFFFQYESPWFDNTFALSHQGIERGEYWQVLTYAWLHSETFPFHIFVNMMLLRFLGTEVEWVLGPWRFLLFYLGGAICSAGVWLLWDSNSNDAVVGASGAVFALLFGYAALFPDRLVKVLIFFIIPIKARLKFIALFSFLVEVACMAFSILPEIAHAAHLGGAIFGWLILWPAGRKIRAAENEEFRLYQQQILQSYNNQNPPQA